MSSSFVVDEERAGQRIDQLVEELGFSNRSRLQHAIDEGWVLVDGQPVKRKQSVRVGHNIEVDIPEVSKETKELPIIFENDNFLVINKPVGILSHAKDSDDREFTVVDFLKGKVEDDLERSGLVHRLDRDTSGVMVAAKTQAAYDSIKEQFSKREVKKVYLAVCDGRLRDEKARLEWPIERNPKKPQLFRVGSNGKSADTEIELIDSSDDYSLVEVRPRTGRTHQIRVHLNHYGNPIVGDAFYGGSKADRLYLHAHKISFKDKGEELNIEAEPEWDLGEFNLG